MTRVVHFELHCDEPERAARFYSDVFGWQFTKWDGPQEYWLVKTGEKDQPGIDGGMMKRMDPNTSVYNTIDVTDLDAQIEKVRKAGGEIVMNKHAIPGVGWIAYFKDTEGNISGMFTGDPNAK
jgi:hypothetical protein